MGYELWLSSKTGYRRRGTRFSEIQSLFEQGLTLASIYEPLRCCCPEDEAVYVYAELERLDFDIAGVMDPDTKKIIGWLKRETLHDGRCAQYIQRFEPSQLASDSTPLLKSIPLLANQPWVFVISSQGISGIVTRADLQKPPIRTLLFGIVSLLEMHLTFWITKYYGDTEIENTVPSARLDKAKELLIKKRKRNEDIGILDCLQFCDKRDLIIKKTKFLKSLELGTKSQAESLLKYAENIRNNVAHSQADLVFDSSWPNLARRLSELEILLHRSDVQVETIDESFMPPKLTKA